VGKIHGVTESLQYSERALLHLEASLKGAEEIERLKSRMDSHLLNRDYGRLVTTVIEFSVPPPIAASFVYAPDFDFDGHYLQDFGDLEHDLSHLIVTLLPAAKGGFLLLSHEDTANKAPIRLIESLKRQSDIASSVVWLIACQTENFAISPDWFESLSDKERDSFKAGFFINANPFDGSVNNLKDRKLSVADWNLRRVFTL